ncbi:hypothetical protein [Mycoplana dimorpha]|uniref:Uncharacterized protein n=1 Tax=Mycoplana dimorpha TaxID=28320 RepID=A0A2T5AIC7_MYCDI|nr:hypothetical protein [Mycoplana dimorpha]PTM86476.1 hypothetical protein C7449_1176 [Mycoplana dimorpha]
MINVLDSAEMGMFAPEDLVTIQKVFEELCSERGIAKGSADARSLARSILRHYSHGVRDPEKLDAILRD